MNPENAKGITHFLKFPLPGPLPHDHRYHKVCEGGGGAQDRVAPKCALLDKGHAAEACCQEALSLPGRPLRTPEAGLGGSSRALRPAEDRSGNRSRPRKLVESSMDRLGLILGAV